MIPFPNGHDDFKAWGLTMFENDELDLAKKNLIQTINFKFGTIVYTNCKIVTETITSSLETQPLKFRSLKRAY